MPAKKIIKKVVVKKSVNPPSLKLRRAKEKPIGEIKHYFGNIKVAVIKFKEPIKVGDTIKIKGGEGTDFKQKISSMQFNHQKVVLAKKGQEVGLKTKEKAREGYKVYKI